MKKNFGKGQLLGPNGEIISVELITPEIARELLSKNTNNRRMKVYSKEKYSRDMKNGNWSFNGDSICITEDDVLGNGQTRLQACVDSNTPFYTIVIRNVKTSAIKNIDTGNSRSVSDVLKLDGYKYSHNLAATARKVMSLEDGSKRKNHSYSSSEIIEEINKPDRCEIYSNVSLFAERIYLEYRALSKANISAAYVKLRLLGHSEDLIKEFFDQLSDQKEACTVIRSFRKKIARIDDRDITATEKFDLLVRTWNEFARGNFESTLVGKKKDCDLSFI